MPLLRTRRRAWLALGLPLVLAASLSACGADRVEAVAREKALGLLQEHLTDAVTCLTSMAAQLEPADTSEELAEVLSDCGNTTLLNEEDDQIIEGALGRRANVIFSGTTVGAHVVLDVMTTGTAQAQAGVAHARAYLVTCWQVTIDLGVHALVEYSDSACSDAVLLLYNPYAEQVPISDLQLPEG